jgi:hypothetical protein
VLFRKRGASFLLSAIFLTTRVVSPKSEIRYRTEANAVMNVYKPSSSTPRSLDTNTAITNELEKFNAFNIRTQPVSFAILFKYDLIISCLFIGRLAF